jgi:hypothetical protein
MADTGALNAARNMLRLHGLRAEAVAMEHIAELRRQGDPDALHHWEETYAAICELRRSAAVQQQQKGH